MKKLKISEYSDYRSYLRELIAENRDHRGYQTHLAAAAGCQRSFMSQVLKGTHDLSREHAAELCVYWDFNSWETDYFINLVDLSRAGTTQLRDIITKKLKRLTEQSPSLNQQVRSSPTMTETAATTYYSAWYWMAIHLAVGLEGQKSPHAIADRLGLPLEMVKEALFKLKEMGFIMMEPPEWNVLATDVHLPAGSPLTEINHYNWRQRALNDVQRKAKDSLHYTSVFTMGKKDAAKLKAFLADTIVTARNAIAPSPNEELYCFLCDFFVV